MAGRKRRGTLIRGRRAPMIQLCPTCGTMRIHHANGLYSCPVPTEVTEAVKAFARSNGSRWKSKLCDLWTSNGDESQPLLRQARNMIGPSRIYKIAL